MARDGFGDHPAVNVEGVSQQAYQCIHVFRAQVGNQIHVPRLAGNPVNRTGKGSPEVVAHTDLNERVDHGEGDSEGFGDHGSP